MQAHRIIVTNGLIERSDKDFLRAVRETGTHIWVSVHHDTPPMNNIIDTQITRWQNAALTVRKNLFTTEW